jgi:circadian clock protein KaiB
VGRVEIKLYVSGETRRSKKAIAAIESVCKNELEGKARFEIIDVLDRPDLAQKDTVFATPNLIKSIPAPIKRLIGDLSNKEKVLLGLDMVIQESEA